VPERSRLARAVGVIIPADNPARHVDGIITTGALLAAETSRHETLTEGAGAVAAVIVVVWLAHSYSAALAQRFECAEPLSVRQLWQTAAHELDLLRGAIVPLIVLLLAGAAGLGTGDAVIAALVSAVVLLFIFEVIAALRGTMRPAELVVQVAVGLVIGAGVLALKVIL
jgi:hypothetical protein